MLHFLYVSYFGLCGDSGFSVDEVIYYSLREFRKGDIRRFLFLHWFL